MKLVDSNVFNPNFLSLSICAFTFTVDCSDYLQAMQLANTIADKKLTDHMLLSWYDRDRDFESPQHASECHQAGAVRGYVDYGLNHGAKLKVDIEQGRFVFFYLPL